MHLHWIVWACDRIEEGTGNFINNVSLDLVCKDSTEALERSRRLVPGKGHYAIRQIIEHLPGECSRKS